jgi:hypothetical protein
MKASVFAAITLFTYVATSHAGLYLNDDFSTFAAGNLAGQNSWSQYGSSATLPIQVSDGQVVFPGGQTADNQDAIKNLSSTITAPALGTLSVFYGLSLTVSSAAAISSPYYFAALFDGTFQDTRFTAKDNGAGGYFLGARVNGQGGYPWAFGTTALSYNTVHKVIIEADMVSGNANDVVKIFVDPTSLDLSLQTPYATCVYGSGTVADPAQFTGFILSQYATATNPNTGLSIGNLAVGDSFSETAGAIGVVPEPSVVALLGIGVAALVIRRRK